MNYFYQLLFYVHVVAAIPLRCIGSGVGAFTAFIIFGARHSISLPGYWQILFWDLPGVVGSACIIHLARKYARDDASAQASHS